MPDFLKEEFHLSYEVKLREVPSSKVMSIRFITSMAEISRDMPKTFQEIAEYVEKNGGKFSGDVFDIFYDEQFDPNRIDVECCISVAEFLPETDRIKAHTVEEALMASTMHKGPYDKWKGRSRLS